MVIVDSHCHLFYEGICEDVHGKIENAKQMGVEYLLTVSTSASNIAENISICEKYSNVFCSVGIHPLEFPEGYDLASLKSSLNNEKVIGIGEVGLDYHYTDKTSQSDQQKLLRDMFSISDVSDLPYIIHARDCFPDILAIIKQYDIKNAVFHCYTDSIENAKKVLDLGYFISFSGALTFKTADDLRKVAKYVPLDRILIETDSPYLAPVPLRGKLNEPANVFYVAECLAGIKNISMKEIAKSTTDNFSRLFKKACDIIQRSCV
ncbi:hypothetical protein FACS1894113_1220 [Alphaproteobacteria bacterium]|nr:hypothetical protein FACS1894113_1220 [Alphaproteobacteria bacterium]